MKKLHAILILFILAAPLLFAATPPADSVYRNGYVYTVDADNSIQEAVAVRDGIIVYTGANNGVEEFIGPDTRVVDLQGKMLMPGLVDGHMHPLGGGAQLLSCNLNYEALTIPQIQSRIQECLDKTKDKEPDGWLEVENWFQQNTLPPGTELTYKDLDVLKTRRPVLVHTSFGHSTLANSRALQLANITASTPDPPAGKIAHDATGKPTGIFEDDAQALFTPLIPQMTDAERLAAATASLDAMRQQGVTTFLDADAAPSTLAAYAALQKQGKLVLRGHFAPLISTEDGNNPDEAVAKIVKLSREYDQQADSPKPVMRVHTAKLYLDGVISAPSFTGVMLSPYLTNKGTAEKPEWVAAENTGPALYFSPATLKELLLKLAAAGIDGHIHADGDGAVRAALDGFESVRAKYSPKQFRAAIAHDEIVDPADFKRYKELDVIPVLSLQWGKPAADTIDAARDYLGPKRFRYIEPSGFLHDAGARIAFGSDWPVDPLNEWFALKVGVTRTNDPSAGEKYAGKLGDDPGLSRETVLRTATINASYELRQEEHTGSLEKGKWADLIVLDRNVMKIPAEDIANVKVLLTVVGGQVVYQSPDWK